MKNISKERAEKGEKFIKEMLAFQKKLSKTREDAKEKGDNIEK